MTTDIIATKKESISKGGSAVQEVMSKTSTLEENSEYTGAFVLQTKLSVGSPDDPYEKEADAVADKVMRMPQQNFIQTKCAQCEEEGKIQPQKLNSFIQKKCADCEEEKVQKKATSSFLQAKKNGSEHIASDALSKKINSSRGKGSKIDSATGSFMSERIGADFGSVSIHTDNESIQMNRELNAKAFTVGNDVYFNEGQYQPGSDSGKHLLAHELTHVVQQTGTIQREEFGLEITFNQLPQCPPQATVDGILYSDEEIAHELYGDVSVPVDFTDENRSLIDINVANLRPEWEQYFVDCVSPNAETTLIPDPPVEIPTDQMVCNVDEDYTGDFEMSAAKVSASKGIRLHTTPDINDCDYQDRRGISSVVYPEGTDITVIATSNRSNVGWVKIQTLDGFEGWIEERFIRRVKMDSTKDSVTKSIYSIKSGDTLEKVIIDEYKNYPYTTGNDRRTIAHALFILNDGETEAFYFTGDGSSWWKDLLDSDFAETRNIYATIRLKEGKSMRLPSRAYIDLLRDKGAVGVRPEWKNTAIELARSIEGFVEGVIYGFGKAIVDTLVGLWDLLKSIVTGELFEQAYEFYKKIEAEGISVIWELIKGFFIGVYNDFVDAWNNPNPYKKWFFFGEIIGMILFEIAIAYLTAGVGTAKHLTKITKVMEKIPGLKTIATKVATKIDDIPVKEASALADVSKAESKLDNLGNISGDTRKILRDSKNEKLLDSLADDADAAKSFDKIPTDMEKLYKIADDPAKISKVSDTKFINDYDAEIPIDGHTFRRSKTTGKWCRFSDPICNLEVTDALDSKVDEALGTAGKPVANSAEASTTKIGTEEIAGTGAKKAGSAEHRAQRWKEYEDKMKGNPKKWNKERWDKQYDINMEQARKSSIAVDKYHKTLDWAGRAEREVRVEIEGVERRMDIMETADIPAELRKDGIIHLEDLEKAGIKPKVIEHKTGDIYNSQDIQWEIARDEILMKEKGWQIEWVFEGYASTPLKAELTKAGIPFKVLSSAI